MNFLYLYLLLGSIAVPLTFSIFNQNFIYNRKAFMLSTLLVAGAFLVWDVYFTKAGIWGFNEDYCLGIYFFQIPIEEVLFFFAIPYASLFIHFALFDIYRKRRLGKTFTKLITIVLIIVSAILIITHTYQIYTLVNFSVLLFLLLCGLLFKLKLLQRFYISFSIISIPFFLVNGILTGAIIEAPIVWYNNLENMGIRMHTIPVEDLGYAFSMLFGNLLLFDPIQKFLSLKSSSKIVSLPQQN
jgi:lycopene cyclase domain-containing protein